MKKTSGKILATSLAALIAVPSVAAFSGCGGSPDLRVYNCFDYIDESLIEEFEDYYKEKTAKEIAEESGQNLKTVQTQIYRAKAVIKKQMEGGCGT